MNLTFDCARLSAEIEHLAAFSDAPAPAVTCCGRRAIYWRQQSRRQLPHLGGRMRVAVEFGFEKRNKVYGFKNRPSKNSEPNWERLAELNFPENTAFHGPNITVAEEDATPASATVIFG